MDEPPSTRYLSWWSTHALARMHRYQQFRDKSKRVRSTFSRATGLECFYVHLPQVSVVQVSVNSLNPFELRRYKTFRRKSRDLKNPRHWLSVWSTRAFALRRWFQCNLILETVESFLNVFVTYFQCTATCWNIIMAMSYLTLFSKTGICTILCTGFAPLKKVQFFCWRDEN